MIVNSEKSGEKRKILNEKGNINTGRRGRHTTRFFFFLVVKPLKSGCPPLDLSSLYFFYLSLSFVYVDEKRGFS